MKNMAETLREVKIQKRCKFLLEHDFVLPSFGTTFKAYLVKTLKNSKQEIKSFYKNVTSRAK
jgi:hypothetical protein